LSNILGLLRDHYLAQKIPTTILDAYYAAFRIPDLVFNIVILGAITASFIPVFTKYITSKNLKNGWHVVNSFINISAIAITVCLVILYFLMPYIVPLLVPDFSPEKQELTLNLSRLILLSPLFFTLSYIFGAVLNSFKRFFVYSLAPLIYNLSIIIATLFFADSLGVYGVVYGVLIGAFLHMLIQMIQVVKIGFKYKPEFDYKNRDVKKIFKMMIPRAVGLGSNQIMLVVYTAIASTLAAGSVAIYNLADNIQTMPTVVFGISFATAIFPTLSEHFNLRRLPQFSSHIHRAIKAIAYILIPLSIMIILLRAQIVRMILGSGHFGWNETILAYNTLAFFMLSLFFQGLIPLFARAFYAIHNTKTPTVISVISVIIGIIMAYVFAPIMGVTGLALAFSIASIFNAFTLYLFLRKSVKEIREQEGGILIYLIKVVFSAVVMGICMQIFKIYAGGYFDLSRFWGVFGQALIAFLIGFGLYFAISKLLKIQQQEELVNLIKRYLYQNGNKKEVKS
jgi:putative peptidoglycan lipid II flippase